ncbi:MAG: hypothetical protein K2L14_05915 [Duncaniella sp.]|nr:hypothetical protein [Duncaniella sp.]
MESVEKIFSDKEGNHLLVALYFYDVDYKHDILRIPEEYDELEIADIVITKANVEAPINHGVFFRMSSWLLERFFQQTNSIFTFVCSTDELDTNHPELLPQTYRWDLFNALYRRVRTDAAINVQDIIIGPEGYQSYGRAFYRDRHASVIHLITSNLLEK